MAHPGIGPGPVVNLTNDPFTSDTAPSWSPDGTRVALQRSGPTAGIWILDAAAGTMGFVPHTDHGFQPSWSPDGSWIAFSRDSAPTPSSGRSAPTAATCTPPSPPRP